MSRKWRTSRWTTGRRPPSLSALDLLLCALAGTAVFGAATWIVGRLMDDFSLAHASFPFACAGVAVFYGWFGSGWYLRRFTISAMVVLWGARLGSRLIMRAAGRVGEEGRWRILREQDGPAHSFRMLGRCALGTLAVIVLSVAFLVPAQDPRVNYHVFEMVGVALWFVALYGEATADAQLAAFKRDPAHRVAVCANGLWRFCRHPNYFFEWLLWVAFFVFALGSPQGSVAAIAPALVLHLLLRVTGVPLNEAQNLRSKGDAYRRYQETTNAFLPWRPRGGTRPPDASTAT